MIPRNKIRVMVVGSGGRLGTALAKSLASTCEVLPITRDQADLTRPETFRDLLANVDFDRLVLTAAQTGVDHCETHPEEAYAANAGGPRTLAGICAEKNAHMTVIGTDFVFRGDADRPYTEEDAPTPAGVYGASKLAGERAVLDASADHLVVRIGWLYGRERPAFPEWILRQACEKEHLALPEDKTGGPTRAEDLVRLLEPLLGLGGHRPASGVIHLANAGSCTWREWGQACVDAAVRAGSPLKCRRIAANRLADVSAFIAPRPPYSVLDTGRYTALTGIRPRPWRDALADHLETSGTFRPAANAR